VLLSKHPRRLVATGRRWVFDDRVAQKLTQEVFLNVFVALPRFRPGGDFAAWLWLIAGNAARSHPRSAQNRQDNRPGQFDGEAGDPVRFGWSPTPEEEARAHRLFKRIDAAVATLPELRRRALLMHGIGDLIRQAITTAPAQPVNTVKPPVYRDCKKIAPRARPLSAVTRGQRW
jgi:RNA polymerase sigma-70 factor (ECF subfamily)